MLLESKVTLHLINVSISNQYQSAAVPTPAPLAQVVRELVVIWELVARELLVALGVGNKLLHYY